MWAIKYVQLQKASFSANLVINRVSILAFLVINMVWVLQSSLELAVFFFEESSFSLSIRSLTKALHELCSRQLCQPKRSKLGY